MNSNGSSPFVGMSEEKSTSLVYFSANREKKYDLGNVATDNAPIGLVDSNGKVHVHNILFIAFFTREDSLRVPSCFL